MLLALLALASAACAKTASPPEGGPAPGEWRTFQGTWSAAGERHTLHFGPGRQASVLSVAGSVLLTGERGLGVGFRAQAIVFSDSLTGGVGRCVWTDDRGDQVFSELTGGPAAEGRHVLGTIVGGTGRYAGATGEYEFRWQYLIETEEGHVQGRVVGLKGRARVGGGAGTGGEAR
jgi:hypothetical protein